MQMYDVGLCVNLEYAEVVHFSELAALQFCHQYFVVFLSDI